MSRLIKLARDYSKTPSLRYEKEGDYSGELFRKTILANAMKESIAKKEVLEVNLDGTAGYGTSFLEESFGGLIREDNIEYTDIKKYLTIISEEEDYLIDDINNYLADANNEKSKS